MPDLSPIVAIIVALYLAGMLGLGAWVARRRVKSADDFMVAVSGDPGRDNGYAFSDNGFIGAPTARKIDLPANWNQLVAETRRGK